MSDSVIITHVSSTARGGRVVELILGSRFIFFRVFYNFVVVVLKKSNNIHYNTHWTTFKWWWWQEKCARMCHWCEL